jgi:hypothetical protein
MSVHSTGLSADLRSAQVEAAYRRLGSVRKLRPGSRP